MNAVDFAGIDLPRVNLRHHCNGRQAKPVTHVQQNQNKKETTPKQNCLQQRGSQADFLKLILLRQFLLSYRCYSKTQTNVTPVLEQAARLLTSYSN